MADTVVCPWADVGPGAERHNSQGLGIGARACWRYWTPKRGYWCCMSFFLDGSSLRCRSVLNQLFVAVNFATPWRWKPSCEGASKWSCLGRKSFSLQSYQLFSRSHWSTSCFLLPLTTRMVAYWYWKLKLSCSLPFSLSTSLLNYAPFFFVKKKKKKNRTERERIFQQRKRQIYARSSVNLLACILSPSRSERRYFHSAKGIHVRKARVVIQQMTVRRVVFFSLRVTPPLWGCGAPSLGWGNFPSWRDFPFERTNQSAFIFTGPNPVVTISTRVGPGSRLCLMLLTITYLKRKRKVEGWGRGRERKRKGKVHCPVGIGKCLCCEVEAERIKFRTN